MLFSCRSHFIKKNQQLTAAIQPVTTISKTNSFHFINKHFLNLQFYELKQIIKAQTKFNNKFNQIKTTKIENSRTKKKLNQ